MAIIAFPVLRTLIASRDLRFNLFPRCGYTQPIYFGPQSHPLRPVLDSGVDDGSRVLVLR